MSSFTYEISGEGVTVQVTVTEIDGALRFDLAVQDGGTIGDLNALFLDLANGALVSGMQVTGDDVTAVAANEDGVSRVSNYTNMNGEVIKELGKFDLGVQFGTQGIGEDDIRETSFTLSHDSVALTIDDIVGQDSGVRLTSVGEEGGTRDDSLKLGGTADPIEDPEGPRDDDPNDPGDGTDPEGPTDGGDPEGPTDGTDPEGPTDGGDPEGPRDGDPNDPSDGGTGEEPTGEEPTGEEPTDPRNDGDPNDPSEGGAAEEPTDEFIFDDTAGGETPVDPVEEPLPTDPRAVEEDRAEATDDASLETAPVADDADTFLF